MPFDLAFVKEHPYEIGGVVIAGGLVLFYLLSRGSGTISAPASTGSSDYAATLNADSQLAQVAAAAQVQTNQQQAQLQAAQIQAETQAQSIQASVTTNNVNTAAQLAGVLGQISGQVQMNEANNYAAITEQANNSVSQENIYGMQEAVLEDQINAGVVENANNNATSLAGGEYQIGAQTTIASQGLTEAEKLASQQQTQYANEVNMIVPLAGQQKNSALDAQDQTSLFQTILSGGNPSVAVSGNNATSTSVVSGNNAGASKVGTISSGISNLLSGLFA